MFSRNNILGCAIKQIVLLNSTHKNGISVQSLLADATFSSNLVESIKFYVRISHATFNMQSISSVKTVKRQVPQIICVKRREQILIC